MREILRTNNIVDLSFAESLLREAGIEHLIADRFMSVVEGSLGVLPQRLLVESGRAAEAAALLGDAGLDVTPPADDD